MTPIKPLKASELYQTCKFSNFPFKDTRELVELEEVIGQQRAIDAVKFGVEVNHKGYNIFALGPTGMGKREFIKRLFEEKAPTQPVPPDICYLHDYDDPDKPKAIILPAGKGVEFQKDMDELIQEMRTALSSAFESDEYQNRRQVIFEGLKDLQSDSFTALQEMAKEKNLTVIRTPGGIAFAPLVNGEVISPDDIQKMTEEEREELEKRMETLQDELAKIVQQVPAWQREMREQLLQLNKEIADFAVGMLFTQLQKKYHAHAKILEHLGKVREQVIENAEEFLPASEGNEPPMLDPNNPQGSKGESLFFRRIKVNLLVDNSKLEGAPVIFEDNPTYQNLIGRVEHIAQMGALLTDFLLIKPGALHRANGGYLVMDARKVLTQPYAWEGLKRVLYAQEISIESLGEALSLISTSTLKPESIPFNAKIALYGDRTLYYLLLQLDPEFADFFKVEADFESELERTEENESLYAQLIASLARKENLRPLNRKGVARVIEQSSRQIEDAERMNIRLQDIVDLLIEADHWASQERCRIINESHVQMAIIASVNRSDRIKEMMQEQILRETLSIETQGLKVGQINGLAVLSIGKLSFGRPSRITASVSLGKGQVLDVEREVDMGGPIHSKGMIILTSFLQMRYAQEKPISLSASIVFEQSYSGIEGDSASSTELYALLSAIANIPIRQNLAVTGSVDQFGNVQAIGGVNEKIEGYFDICKARGLTGDQGVLIPKANLKHLMLRQDVVQAVKEKQFFVYPVSHIDEGIEILTGIKAGIANEHGKYPKGSINAAIEERLNRFLEASLKLNQKKVNERNKG